MPNDNFGLHLTLDLSKCNINKLKDFETSYSLLEKLPKLMNMTKITRPYVIKWLDKNARIPGISGFVMIAESHISIHTFPERYYAFADVFSCRNFHINRCVEEFINTFESKKYEKNTIKRGFDSVIV